MKAFVLGSLGAAALAAAATVSAQQYTHYTCDFDIIGTWETGTADEAVGAPIRYDFGPDGVVRTLTRHGEGRDAVWQEDSPSRYFNYRLDDPQAPSSIQFLGKDSVTVRGSMEISQYDEDSFTTLDANDEATRWVRVDLERYFLQFAGRSGSVTAGGPAFATLVRVDAEGRTHTDAFGYFTADGEPVVGTIPTALRTRLMNESPTHAHTLLRVELTSSEFERSLDILRTWERRARERKMLYEVPYLNSIVFLEEIAMSLNVCTERLRLHNMDWTANDKVTAKHNLPQVSYEYIKELRKLNDPLHLTDEQFRRRAGGACTEGCRALVGSNAAR